MSDYDFEDNIKKKLVDVNGWIENGRGWVFRGGRGVQQKRVSCVEIGESPLANLVKALLATTGRNDVSREIALLLNDPHRLAGAARMAEICLYGYFKRFVAKLGQSEACAQA